jgi:acyl-CoA thioesterase-1
MISAKRATSAAAAVLLLATIGACGGARPESTPSPAPSTSASPEAAGAGARAIDDRAVILFVGTSLTAGLGLDPSEAYPALVEE